MLAADRDDADVVHHLDPDGEMVSCLHELIGVVVELVGHHRAGGDAEAHDAAFAQRAIFGIIGFAARGVGFACLDDAGAAGVGAGDACGDAAIAGIGDERRAALPVDAHHPVARIGPAGIVAAIDPARAAPTFIQRVGAASDRRPVFLHLPGRRRVDARVAGEDLPFDLLHLDIGVDQLVAELAGAFEIGRTGVGPDAAKVRLAAGEAGRLVAGLHDGHRHLCCRSGRARCPKEQTGK